MRTVAIAGVGLIGGSFGLALRKAGFPGAILGVSSPRSIDQALERGAIDRAATLEEAAATADLVFLSQPIFGILETIEKLGPLVRPETLVTDAGSTKQTISEAAHRHLTRCTFLGGHPMAGKELRGAAAADGDLFRGRPWILTAEPDHPTARAFRQWLALFGAREIVLDPARHDRLVAWGSHLPQLLSTALAAVLHDQAPDAALVAGPGLMDMTRLALSSYELWGDILETNMPGVSMALDAYIGKLRQLRDGFESEFAKGSQFARSLRTEGPRPGPAAPDAGT
jgi:prephenate dehydrogenase